MAAFLILFHFVNTTVSTYLFGLQNSQRSEIYICYV